MDESVFAYRLTPMDVLVPHMKEWGILGAFLAFSTGLATIAALYASPWWWLMVTFFLVVGAGFWIGIFGAFIPSTKEIRINAKDEHITYECSGKTMAFRRHDIISAVRGKSITSLVLPEGIVMHLPNDVATKLNIVHVNGQAH